jgi:hypothetical protein
MYTNVNLWAPLGVVAFLAACFCFVLAVVLLFSSLVFRKMLRAGLTMIVILAGLGLYFGLMAGFSVAGAEQVLDRGAEKHFCEVDCHLAYSVVDVKKTRTIGDGPNQAAANGLYYIVTVKTRFDEATISPTRGNGPLTPSRRVVEITDEQGRQYKPSPEGQRALELSNGGGTPISTPLRPSESYTTALVFDLPAGVENPSLMINSPGLLSRFIIGHENSFLHAGTKFSLSARAEGSRQ